MTMVDDAGEPWWLDPRVIVRRMTDKIAELGLTPVVAMELEFYLVEPETDELGRPRLACAPGSTQRPHALRVGAGIWGTLEAGHYYLALRRRLRLGLADPVVANRILLFTFASIGGAVIFSSTAVANAGGRSMEEVMGTAQIVLISTTTFVVAGCQWFAFLPPRRYQAWLSGKAVSA
jgi:hypothetical protein